MLMGKYNIEATPKAVEAQFSFVLSIFIMSNVNQKSSTTLGQK